MEILTHSSFSPPSKCKAAFLPKAAANSQPLEDRECLPSSGVTAFISSPSTAALKVAAHQDRTKKGPYSQVTTAGQGPVPCHTCVLPFQCTHVR